MIVLGGDGKFSEAFLTTDGQHETNVAPPQLTFPSALIVANASTRRIIGAHLSTFFNRIYLCNFHVFTRVIEEGQGPRC
jgi:hypothetical protein